MGFDVITYKFSVRWALFENIFEYRDGFNQGRSNIGRTKAKIKFAPFSVKPHVTSYEHSFRSADVETWRLTQLSVYQLL
jgi:hypothetical protein